jgi:hypothetical protein
LGTFYGYRDRIAEDGVGVRIVVTVIMDMMAAVP